VEQRKLPLSSYILFVLVIIGAISGFMVAQDGKNKKAQKILNRLGYQYVTNLKVYSKTNVEDIDTKMRGIKFFVSFEYNHQKCKGFILKDYRGNIKKDIDCKTIQ
jgi:hypothetical protein